MTATQAILVLFPFSIIVGWITGCHIGWLLFSQPDGDPYNWRVSLGPWSYFAWLERTQ